jgi:hypothetical protein
MGLWHRPLRSVLRLWYFFGSLSLIFLRAETAMSSWVRPVANAVGETPDGLVVMCVGSPRPSVGSISRLAMEAKERF